MLLVKGPQENGQAQPPLLPQLSARHGDIPAEEEGNRGRSQHDGAGAIQRGGLPQGGRSASASGSPVSLEGSGGPSGYLFGQQTGGPAEGQGWLPEAEREEDASEGGSWLAHSWHKAQTLPAQAGRGGGEEGEGGSGGQAVRNGVGGIRVPRSDSGKERRERRVGSLRGQQRESQQEEGEEERGWEESETAGEGDLETGGLWRQKTAPVQGRRGTRIGLQGHADGILAAGDGPYGRLVTVSGATVDRTPQRSQQAGQLPWGKGGGWSTEAEGGAQSDREGERQFAPADTNGFSQDSPHRGRHRHQRLTVSDSDSRRQPAYQQSSRHPEGTAGRGRRGEGGGGRGAQR